MSKPVSEREKAVEYTALQTLREFLAGEAFLADKSSHEWAKEPGGEVQAAYRAGMWYAYHAVKNQLLL